MTDEELQFIYEREVWFISAFVNTNQIDIIKRLEDIEKLINEKIKNLDVNDLGKIKWNQAWVEKVIDMGKNLTIKIDWQTFLEGFPYLDENTNVLYNNLGYFIVEAEYYKNNPEQKKSIETPLIQQIPIVVANILKRYCDLKKNEYLYIDNESPIFDFVVSKQTTPIDVLWSQDNIEKYKRVIGNWTEIYSGSWPDYNEMLYSNRVVGNLSNRLSELHFIRRNSGFIYMKEQNYNLFFNSYMIPMVLTPTAQIRAILFALTSVNLSLDILYMRQTIGDFQEVDKIEEKMKNLRMLRGSLQTQLSSIYNELDYNRRQHYTAVLSHLLDEFNINGVMKRINEKFDIIYDGMQRLYQRKNEENQERQEKVINMLNVLFSLGILADFTGLVLSFISDIASNNIFGAILNGVSSFVIIGVAIFFIMTRIKFQQEDKMPHIRYTVDGIIIDDDNRILVIKRKFPPFKGQYALPGGFIEPEESAEEAIIREIKEETNLNVSIIKDIGIFDSPNRDPRGTVVSHAFQCKIIGEPNLMCKDDAEQAEFLPLEQIKGLDLAFDHEDILKAAKL